MKTEIFSFYVSIILLLTSLTNCKKGDCDGGDIELSATPNPVTAVYEGEIAIWTFSVTLKNNTCESITLGPISEKFYDTDTRYTHQKVYREWSGAGREVPSGESYSSSRYARTNQAHSGKYDFTMIASGKDGQEYEAIVTLLFQ